MFELYTVVILWHRFFNYTFANIIITLEVCHSNLIAENTVGGL